MQNKRLLASSALAAGAFYATVGHAHVGHHHVMSGFDAGLLHPLTGLDHLAATLAVGVLAGRQGGHAMWALPAAFVGVLLIAALVGMNGVVVAGAELGVLATIIAAGLLLVSRQWGPLPLIAAVTAVVALIHGYIHGHEAVAGSLTFLLGLALVTAALQGAGVLLGRVQICKPATRLAGGAMVAGALASMF